MTRRDRSLPTIEVVLNMILLIIELINIEY
jgi:hypothetical protein